MISTRRPQLNQITSYFAALLLLLVIAPLSPSSAATTRTWNSSTANWSVTGDWSPSGTPATGDTLIFQGSGITSYTASNNLGIADSTIQLNSTASVAEIINGNNFAEIQILLTITQQGSGAFSISNGASFKGAQLTLNGNGSGIVTLSGVFSDASGGQHGSLVKAGTSAFVLSGANTFTDGVTISGGTLSVATIGNGGVAGNLGQSSTAAAKLVFDGGTLQYTGATASTNRNFTINAGKTATFDITANTLTVSGASTNTNGALTKIGTGTLVLSGTNLYTGLTTVTGGTLREGVSNAISTGGLTVNGSTAVFDLGAFSDSVGTVTLDGGGSITSTTGVLTSTVSFEMKSGSASAILAGSGKALNKTTGGTVILTGANTYTGGTVVSGGTLLVNNTSGSGTGSGAVTVNGSGTTLGGTGIITGPTTINADAMILGGTGATGATQKLTLSGSLTLASTSVIELALGPSGAHSTLARTGGTWTFASTQAFSFIDLGATTGAYDNIITGVLNPTSQGSWTITNSGFVGTFTWDGIGAGIGNIDLTLTAVPEPSTWIAGALALLALGYAQRRRFVRKPSFAPAS